MGPSTLTMWIIKENGTSLFVILGGTDHVSLDIVLYVDNKGEWDITVCDIRWDLPHLVGPSTLTM